MRTIAEVLLMLAEKEVGSAMHSTYEYLHNLIKHLDKHPVHPLSGGISVPVIELTKNNEPYDIAELNMRGDIQQIALHKKNGTVPHLSPLTACIMAHKREMGRRPEDHHFYDLHLNVYALAVIILYIAPHCSTLETDIKDLKKILKKLGDPAWLDNRAALTQINMPPLEARDHLDKAGLKFAFAAPLDLFLTEKHDELDQERNLINGIFQSAYTQAKKLHDEAGMLTYKMGKKADNIVDHLRTLSQSIRRETIRPGLHRILAERVLDRNSVSLYSIFNTHRILPELRSSETKSARLFRMHVGSTSTIQPLVAETNLSKTAPNPPAYNPEYVSSSPSTSK